MIAVLPAVIHFGRPFRVTQWRAEIMWVAHILAAFVVLSMFLSMLSERPPKLPKLW